ncbi:hypothetical protein WOLCODRAFT_153318 [Wolfiporia cocos MD-104 SS10]|uniref:Uncharacterized protein n=1 Tax=Wolfiporia cocos (strain MD-104) TaxID=742152 RepID=A0A2H3K2J0_WOLCO|nr:hypothetical protein WOLCODRAFT_153318 [Wolfiporia cocos MD-104 SS10]
MDYLGYAISGSDGILSLSPETTNGTDACGLDLTVSPGEVYYFHTNGPAALVDPHVFTTVSSHSSSCDSDFRPTLIQRDEICIFTNAETTIRSLKSSDVAGAANAEPDTYCLTIQSFAKEPLAKAYDGLDARLRSPLPDHWPPEVILTAIYAGAAIEAWGPLGTSELLRNTTDNLYYPDGYYKRGTDNDGAERERGWQRRKEAQDKQTTDRREACEQRRGLHDTEFDALDVVAFLWDLNNRPALERAKRIAEAEAKQRSAEKVTEWLNGH